MEFSKNDFARLQYNVYDLPEDKEVLEHWKELKRFPEFTTKNLTGINRDKVMRYIILVYDKRSPLLSQKNLSLRKKTAAELAGFEKNEAGLFQDSVMAMINLENKHIARMIIRYARIQSDTKYALLVAGMEALYENLIKISATGKDEDVIDSAEKSKLFEQSEKMGEKLERMADELFNNDLELMSEADQVGEEENGRISSYPEWAANQKVKKRELEKQADTGS